MVNEIITRKEGHFLVIQFNRPQKKNALTEDMYRAIVQALNDSEADEEILFTVFTGVGSFYSSGHDFSTIPDGNNIESTVFFWFVKALIDHPKPLIALVNGPAYGMAVVILGLFELVLASDRATFQVPTSTLDLTPIGCCTYTFPSIMGYSRASEMLIFGKKISAKEGEISGLVTKVFPNETFHAASNGYLHKFSKLPKTSIIATKHLLRQQNRALLHEICEIEAKSIVLQMNKLETRRILTSKFKQKSKL